MTDYYYTQTLTHALTFSLKFPRRLSDRIY